MSLASCLPQSSRSLVVAGMANSTHDPHGPGAHSPQGLRVLLIEEHVRPTALLRDELVRMGCEVVGVLDAPTLIHDCVATRRNR